MGRGMHRGTRSGPRARSPSPGGGGSASEQSECEPGWGELAASTHPTPTLTSFASTLPLQGRVAPSAGKARVGRARAAAFDAAQIDFDPRSETLDEDYAAFHIVKKSLPHAEAKAIEDRFQAAFVKVREEHRRWVNNYFHFWIACEDPACKRKEGCAGDPYACHQRWWPWTPERYKVRYRAYVKARAEGGTPSRRGRMPRPSWSGSPITSRGSKRSRMRGSPRSRRPSGRKARMRRCRQRRVRMLPCRRSRHPASAGQG